MRSADRNHPGRALLLRFLQGRANRPETWAVVRHLLTGCPECGGFARRIWRFADRPLRSLDPLESADLGSAHGEAI